MVIDWMDGVGLGLGEVIAGPFPPEIGIPELLTLGIP